RHCQVLSETAGPSADWVPFKLWPAQRDVARLFQERRLVVVLKARQLGLTWLALAFALWQVPPRPPAPLPLFSHPHPHAPPAPRPCRRGAGARGSAPARGRGGAAAGGPRVGAPRAGGGDLHPATLAVVDEADLVPDLDRLLRAVKPTTDAAGRLLLISRADKGQPESAFKRIYRSATAGESSWAPVFLPWHARPDRDATWYEAQKRDVLAR